MRLVVTEGNRTEWFKQAAEHMERLSDPELGYADQIRYIETLAARGDDESVIELATYLRPWDISAEGNWGGKEWVRVVAMQALGLIALKSPRVATLLEEIESSDDPKWTHYSPKLVSSWTMETDCSCDVDPYQDFLRNIRDVLQCIVSSISSEEEAGSRRCSTACSEAKRS